MQNHCLSIGIDVPLGQKQTFAVQEPMPAKGEKRTSRDNRKRPRVNNSGPLLAGCLISTDPDGSDHLLDLGFYSFEVERSRGLHWRELDGSLRQFCDVLLDHHEAPELPGKELVHVARRADVQRFASNGLRALERILTNVDHRRHVGRGLFARPAPRLLEERELEVIETQSTQRRATEIEDFVTL